MHVQDGDTVWAVLERRAAATPEAPAAVDEHGRELSFAGLRQEAESMAAALAARGVGEGTVVSWQLPSWIESFVLMAALARLGALQNPIVPISREREVGFAVRQLRSRLLIVPTVWRGFDYEAMATTIAATTPGLEVLATDGHLPRGDAASLPPPPQDADPVRWVLYTSGTTSDPKGARHTDRTVLHNGVNFMGRLQMRQTDRVAMVSPMGHIGGLAWFVITLVSGCCCVFVERFDEAAIRVLASQRITLPGTATPFHEAYLAAQLATDEPLFPHVRTFVGGGATRTDDLHWRLKKTFGVGVVSGYGSTETGLLTVPRLDDPDEVLATTEGSPYDTTEIRIMRRDGTPAEVGEAGEVCARGPQMMLGYVDPALDTAFTPDGFFRTGDLGILDAGGNLRITGRLKDVIIRKGENISAREVETLLARHPAVAEVAVLGLPDPVTGERCCAVVVLTPGAEPPTVAGLRDYLVGQGLSVRKAPEQLEIAEYLPRTAVGKVMKHVLRAGLHPEKG